MQQQNPNKKFHSELVDKDHFLWSRPQWEHSVPARKLRRLPSLSALMYRDVHEAKHKETPPVPLLSHYTIVRALNCYEPGETPIDSLDNLMEAIDNASNSPKAHEIEKHLAELAIWTLDLQRPYIEQSPEQPSLATVIDLGSYRDRREIVPMPRRIV